MQVICTDGTTFTGEGFELTEYGIIVYGQELDPNDERYAGDPEQAGFVPHDRLWYVLPDGVEPNVPAPATRGDQGQQPPQGMQQPQHNSQQPPSDHPVTPPEHGQQPTWPQQDQRQQQPPGQR
jgi:hypothetical protein